MKKLIFMIACLSILWGYQVQAQDNLLYPLISKENGNAVTLVGNTLEMRARQTGENKIAQLFYLKRIGNGKVRIVSAANHQLYLKRNGNNISLAVFNTGEAGKFDWEVYYAGYPYCTLNTPGNLRQALKVQGNGLVMGTMPVLANNGDTRGDAYRFTFGKRQNLSLKPEENTY